MAVKDQEADPLVKESVADHLPTVDIDLLIVGSVVDLEIDIAAVLGRGILIDHQVETLTDLQRNTEIDLRGLGSRVEVLAVVRRIIKKKMLSEIS